VPKGILGYGKWYKLYGGFWFYFLVFKGSIFCLGVPVL